MESRKIGEPYNSVSVADSLLLLNPDPLFAKDILNNEIRLSIEKPTLNSHYLILSIIRTNGDQKLTEPILVRGKMQSTYENV